MTRRPRHSGNCPHLPTSRLDDPARVELDRSAIAFGYERWTAVLQTGLEVMRECGELRAEANPRALAQSLIVAHQGGSLLMRTYRTAEPLRNALNTTLDFIRSLRY
jgi:TetR/AcrR family transcriptional repressor of nem operon